MKCRKCDRSVQQCGGYLQRVNEKGVPGIWECRPTCDSDLPFDTRLLLALEGEDQERAAMEYNDQERAERMGDES